MPRCSLENRDEQKPAPVHPIEDIFSRNADFVWRLLRRLGVRPADVDDAPPRGFLGGAPAHRRIRGSRAPAGVALLDQPSSCEPLPPRRDAAPRTATADRDGRAAPDVEEEMARREAGRLVNAFLDELDESQRIVF